MTLTIFIILALGRGANLTASLAVMVIGVQVIVIIVRGVNRDSHVGCLQTLVTIIILIFTLINGRVIAMPPDCSLLAIVGRIRPHGRRGTGECLILVLTLATLEKLDGVLLLFENVEEMFGPLGRFLVLQEPVSLITRY